MNNRSMPPCGVVPELAYPDVRAAVDWLCGAYGFTERLRIGEHRAQLMIADACVVVTALDSALQYVGGHSIMVRVPDVNAHHAQAAAFGATILAPPRDQPYGERQYGTEDLGGHRWTFSQSIADVDPAAWGGVLVNT